MTFRMHHDWKIGAFIVAARLATCAHCETLRVTEGERSHFIKRAIDPLSPAARRGNLVLEEEPPCVAPPPFFAPPSDAVPCAAFVAAPPRAAAPSSPPAALPAQLSLLLAGG